MGEENTITVYFLEVFSKRFRPGSCFSKVPVTFRARKAALVYRVRIQVSVIENDTMKLSVNEAKLMVVSKKLWYYSMGFEFKICIRARKVTGPFEKWGPGPHFRKSW